MKKKNEAELKSFIAYCEANPNERFWQALRNWSGAVAIWHQATGAPLDVDLSASLDHKGKPLVMQDTFYWENFKSK